LARGTQGIQLSLISEKARSEFIADFHGWENNQRRNP